MSDAVIARKVTDELTWRTRRLYREGTPVIQTTVRSIQVSRTQVKEQLQLLKGEEGWACTCVFARTVRMCFSSHALPFACVLLPKRYTSSRARLG